MDPVLAAFGRVIHELRKEKKLSQETLGEDAGLQRKYVSLLELGRHQPKLLTIFALARALGLSPGELLARVEKDVVRKRRKTLRV